ncbi:ribosomal protein L7/L12 [Rhizobium leguminosarum]|uniref:ribosomal protein L7/L12 n=1 Tax=Rhizobium leguminosarum TaxID=384 RepID=UPI001A92186A|nr:ribosomal protein L7/L12 [Rhizobium leguminosarum]MBY5553765.1 ribosomal protein L7/L12 [Rhizobium leguminosarum]QSW24824.1 ribosomal protein L7/L12 [Rhizobium leguminosarum]
MGTFEKGQWLRVTDNAGAPRFYSVGEVCQVESIDGTVRCVGKSGGMYPYRFEAWQPKVGDRVRLVKDGRSTTGAVGKTATISSWTGGVLVDTDEYLLDIDPPVDYKTAAVTENFTRATIDCFEPLPAPAIAAPAPLTITAGGYYKTRDGRKVGPIVVAQGPDDPWPWKLADGTRYYRNDGFSCPGWADGHRDEDDLVAVSGPPWTTEPAVIKAKYVGDQPASNDNAAPAKFKVGDRVITKSGYTFDGSPGTIVEANVNGDADLYHVKIENHPHAGDNEWSVRTDYIDFVTARAPAIVALIENGKPKPAFEPKVHASEAEATVEAERLAGVYRGQRFGIFVLSDTREADIPIYGHEWQNFAARGEKIRAIKELRAITGMGLKPAKDAVEYFLAAA